MPNTFSMAPRYVRDFAARTAFESPQRDVFGGLERKLARLHRDPLPTAAGIALLGDARDSGERTREALRSRGLPDRARLVVTSPPYLRVVKYGYYNWLRTWLLGYDARAIDAALDDAHHREPYLAFLREVLADLRSVLADDAIVVLVIGDVETDRGRPIRGDAGLRLAERVWAAAAEPEGYRLAGIALDEVAANRKMTKLWGAEAGQRHEDRSDPGPRRDRERSPAGAGGRRNADRMGLAAARPPRHLIDMDVRSATVPIVHALLAGLLGILTVVMALGWQDLLASASSANDPHGYVRVFVTTGVWGFLLIFVPLIGVVLLGMFDWQAGRGPTVLRAGDVAIFVLATLQLSSNAAGVDRWLAGALALLAASGLAASLVVEPPRRAGFRR